MFLDRKQLFSFKNVLALWGVHWVRHKWTTLGAPKI